MFQLSLVLRYLGAQVPVCSSYCDPGNAGVPGVVDVLGVPLCCSCKDTHLCLDGRRSLPAQLQDQLHDVEVRRDLLQTQRH